MSLLHQHLYDSETLSSLNMKEYIQTIITEIAQIYQDKQVQIVSTIDECILDIDSAIAIGVIINEVLNNAIKYAPKNKKCYIHLSLKYLVHNNKLVLKIQDNGIGIDTKKLDTYKGLGLGLIKQFSNKLNNATYRYKNNDGTLFSLIFTL